MDKQEISNKVLKLDDKKTNKVNKKSGYKYNNTVYTTLRDIPIPLEQAKRWLECGKIKKV